jgi:hypothetical protein
LMRGKAEKYWCSAEVISPHLYFGDWRIDSAISPDKPEST